MQACSKPPMSCRQFAFFRWTASTGWKQNKGTRHPWGKDSKILCCVRMDDLTSEGTGRHLDKFSSRVSNLAVRSGGRAETSNSSMSD